jgi:DTW domain-containing protein YfiP
MKIEDPRQGQRAEAGLNLEVKECDNRIEVVVLQHPQEPDKELGTAALLVRSLKKSQLKVGLSWRSLEKVLGRPVERSRWGVLYLGGKNAKLKGKEVFCVDKKNIPLPQLPVLEGVIVLDGTWSQVKALWWRNAWLLKLNRIVLDPKRPSLYGNLRREPRRECLSTIESVALALQGFGESEAYCDDLRENFANFLAAVKASREAQS